MKTEIVVITVTAENIAIGRALCKNSLHTRFHSCPISLALRDATGKDSISIGTSPDRAYFGIYEAALPQKAKDFISAFDAGRDVKPLSFVLKFTKNPEEKP